MRSSPSIPRRERWWPSQATQLNVAPLSHILSVAWAPSSSFHFQAVPMAFGVTFVSRGPDLSRLMVRASRDAPETSTVPPRSGRVN